MILCSCFNFPFSHMGIHALWNSLSGCTVILSEAEARALMEKRAADLPIKTQEFLLQRGILTKDPEELRHFLEMRRDARANRSPHFRILTTTACNARCGYCYERDFPIQTMTEETAAAVAEFIARQYRLQCSGKAVSLEWFGGEPTLNPAAIHTITHQLHTEKIPFRTSMVTNGLLLTETLISNASHWNLRFVQITLDGAGQQYEAVKQLPPGSFEQVLANIDRCLSCGVDVTIRINEAGNWDRIEYLLNLLAKRYAVGKKPKIYISPLYGPEKHISSQRMRKILELNEFLIHSELMNFEEVYDLRQRDRCFSATPWGFTIMPDGTLLNCSHNASWKNSYGTIFNYRKEDALHQKFLSDALPEDCYDCVLLPICGGGCSASQYEVAELNLCIPYRNVITEILVKRIEHML